MPEVGDTHTRHGFKASHPLVLRKWASHLRDDSNPAQNAAYKEIVEAYDATATWARRVQTAMFPRGEVVKRSAPLDQSQKFKPYTWTRIYPRKDFRRLAYTVGIDSHGEFCVKLDTVSVGGSQRERYKAIHGGDHAASPICAVLPFEEGMTLSLEGLTAWSLRAIAAFEPGYDELARRIGLIPGAMQLVDDPQRSRDAFRRWADIMAEGAQKRGPVLRLPMHGVVFQETASTPLAARLGLDPRGVEWGVEINEPDRAGDYNGLSGIGEDPSGGLHLLRQGWLRGRRSAPDIREDAFMARTGLKPVEVAATGQASKRRWFIVADLDGPAEAVRRETARFADLCWLARSTTSDSVPEGEADKSDDDIDQGLDDLSTGMEKGGWFTRTDSEAKEAERFRLRHGEVWMALTERLAAAGIPYRKRRRLGFEIDLEIDHPGGSSLLIEIKAGGGASSLHTGIGQLYLYRKLIGRLADSEPVLLTEARAAPAVAAAVEALGVALHHYDFQERDELPDITFDPEFLALCGLS